MNLRWTMPDFLLSSKILTPKRHVILLKPETIEATIAETEPCPTPVIGLNHGTFLPCQDGNSVLLGVS